MDVLGRSYQRATSSNKRSDMLSRGSFSSLMVLNNVTNSSEMLLSWHFWSTDGINSVACLMSFSSGDGSVLNSFRLLNFFLTAFAIFLGAFFKLESTFIFFLLKSGVWRDNVSVTSSSTGTCIVGTSSYWLIDSLFVACLLRFGRCNDRLLLPHRLFTGFPEKEVKI